LLRPGSFAVGDDLRLRVAADEVQVKSQRRIVCFRWRSSGADAVVVAPWGRVTRAIADGDVECNAKTVSLGGEEYGVSQGAPPCI